MQIREANDSIKLVAVSADDSQVAQYEMSRAGAVGYVVKGSPDDEIIRVIRSAMRW
jgi:DNA-binding NarL/FixJ family response regulator